MFNVIRCMSVCYSYVYFSQMADLDLARPDVDPLQHHGSDFSPLLPHHEAMLDLEQQWQDVLDVLGPQVTPFHCLSFSVSSYFEFLNTFSIGGKLTRKMTPMKQHNINQQV